MTRKRDYKKEYREYHGKPEHIKERSERNRARRKMGLKVGDPREVDHVIPLSKGGDNSDGNLQVLTREENRKKGAKLPAEKKGFGMENTIKFNDQWKRHRKAVHEAREKYQGALTRLEPYKGSGGCDRDIAKAREAFEGELEAARNTSRPVFDAILDDMRGGVSPSTMDAPSDEQLRLLQMLDMRDSLTAEEIEAAAKSLDGCDAAIATLGDIARRNGRILPPSVKGRNERIRSAIDELTGAVKGLMAWDGRTRAELVRERTAQYVNHTGNNRQPIDAVFVADVEAGAPVDTFKALGVDGGTMQWLR